MHSYREIIYFPIRGRIEPARLLMEDLELAYLDTRIDYERWSVVKRSLPFRELPMYKDEHCTMVQSHAIFHYLARQNHLYGKTEQDHVHCDVLMEGIKDATEELGKLFWDEDFSIKREHFIQQQLIPRLTRLDEYLKNSHSEGIHWVGNTNTIIDYVGWNFLDFVRALQADLLHQFPMLNKSKQEFEKRINIREYLKSERRPKTITIPLAQFGGTLETS